MALVGKASILRLAASRGNVFYVLMGCASAISLLKVALLAVIMPRAEFALYASVFAVVAFASEIISFGLTQATVKKYPRLVAFDRAPEIEADLVSLGKTLLFRYIAIFTLLASVSFYGWGTQGLFAATGVLLIAVGTNMFSVIASICRAYDHLKSLALFAVLRALAASSLSVLLAFKSDWTVVLLGEGLLSAIIGLAILAYLRRQISRQAAAASPDPTTKDYDRVVSGKHDGLLTFAAFVLLMVPTSFDRMFVSAVDTLDTKTLFAFIGIWMTAAVTVLGIYTQKFGPDIVRQMAYDPNTKPLAQVRRHALILAALLATGTLVSFGFVRLFLFDQLWTKYGLTWEVTVVTAVTTATFVSVLYDWTLLALDGEYRLLGGSVLLVALVAIMFCTTALFHFGFFGYMASLCIARLCQIAWQDRAVASLQSSYAQKRP